MPVEHAVQRPTLLKPGGHIRVVSPSYPSMSYVPPRAKRAETALRALGFRVSYGEHAWELTDDGRSAGSPEQRADDFMAAVTDPDVDAIFSAGGGGTSWEILPLLDGMTISKNAKPFIGECENVWLHQYLLHEVNLASYYGAGFMTDFGEAGGIFPETAKFFIRALCEPGELSCEPVPDRTNLSYNWMDPTIEATPRARLVGGGWQWINEGRGKGQFVGGEAAYLARCIDRFAPDLDGSVLFWHVMPNNGAPPVDLLRDLAERTDLSALAGMIVGTDVRHDPPKWAAIVAAALADVVGSVDYPVMVNADLGHTGPGWVLPYGLDAVLDSSLGLRFPASPMSPSTWDETAVRALVEQQFAELLPSTRLAGTDNFFSRGGDSFGMLRMISALQSNGLPLTARDFVARPTPDGVVASVMARLPERADVRER
jgi:muramoyltetrapeptide carboxypeptidase